MSATHPFFSIHRQGMIRAGVCTPVTTVGDPAANARAAIALAQQGDAQGADLLVFPELNVTSYAIDDLHLQEALLDRVEVELAGIVAASADMKPVLLVGAALRRNGRLYNTAVAIARGEDEVRPERHGLTRHDDIEPREADARREPAFLIIFAIIGQIGFGHDAQHRAACDDDGAVI